MSSAGNFSSREMPGNSPQSDYCCGCQRIVTLMPLPNSELSCPNCKSTFLEESETIPPSDHITRNNSFGDRILIVFSTVFGGSDDSDLSAVLGGCAFPGQSFIELDPAVLSNSYLSDGASIVSMLENNHIVGGGSEYMLPENFGDHFLIQHWQLIQRLTASDLNRHGSPPAAKSAVSGLPDFKVSDELFSSNSSQCVVCKDSFELDELVKKMPCKHMYHKDCILPWLEMRNSCRVCQYELPTDDSDYENKRQSTNTSTNTNTNNDGNNANLFYLDSEGGGNPRTVERRVRISLPGLLRGLESHAETSNSGGGGSNDGVNNDGNDSSSNNIHGESYPSPGGQERHEDS